MNTCHAPQILKAQESDLQAILDLQYLAYQSEAKLLNDLHIPPLQQTYHELEEEFSRGVILKAVDSTESIIGSVRAYSQENTVYIGKLIVHPSKQRQGIGSRLLLSVEKFMPCQRYELFTSSKSIRNITLYTSLGYHRCKETIVSEKLTFIFLEKINTNIS